MALVTLSSPSTSAGVISGRIRIPRVGAWYADLVVDHGASEDLAGAVELAIGNDQVRKGTAHRLGDRLGRTHVRVVAGAGGLQTPCKPKAYGNVPLRLPLNDVLSGAGEQLSSTADARVLAHQLPAWSTLAQASGEVVAELAAAIGATWRMLVDGTLWVGVETWPSSEITDYSLVDSEPEFGRVKIASDEPTLLPGTSLDLGNVSYVEHHIGADRVRTLAWVETAAAAFDRVKAPWVAFTQAAMRKVDRYARFRARVVKQSGNRFDVAPDSPYLPSFSNVPVRLGLPAASVSVNPGAYVLIGFMGGDPQQPYVASFEGGENNASPQPVARKGDHADVGKLTLTVGGTATLAWTYVDADGVTTSGVSGGPITVKGKITEGSGAVSLG